MDIDVPEDSDFNPSPSDASTSDIDAEHQIPRNNQVETLYESPRTSPVKGPVDTKWDQLRKHYNPKYLDLFRETFQQTSEDEIDATSFEASQIGAVVWQPYEKARLFRGLQRHGRDALHTLTKIVSSKSELEIKAYLDLLKQSELERQLYERQTKNISAADIATSIEIGGECERALNTAAEALEAYQEQYDYAAAIWNYETAYIITSEVAQEIDAATEEAEKQAEDAEVDGAESLTVASAGKLFKLSHFTGLSTDLFMQGTAEQPHENWMNLAVGEESPSLTQDAVTDFFNIVVGLTQRLVQSIIFTTESRLRATSSKNHTPQHTIRFEDVETSLDILNCQGDLWRYWIEFPGRRGLPVYSGSHQKGQSRRNYLSMDDVQMRLSEAAYRGRHSRSVSLASATDISDSDGFGSLMNQSTEDPATDEDENDGAHQQPSHEEEGVSDAERMHQELSESETGSEPEESAGGSSQPLPVSRAKRMRLLEDEQDKYMEEMDQHRRREEEQRIAELLGPHRGARIKSEDSEPPRKRPKVLRKTVEDVCGWEAPALAAWEAYNLHALEDAQRLEEGVPEGPASPSQR